jgi:allophanate hydrolase
MQQTFDLRLATLAANYRNGNTTPRALLRRSASGRKR